MKRVGILGLCALVLALALAGVARAGTPTPPQEPNPYRPGRLVRHPPWAAPVKKPVVRHYRAPASVSTPKPTPKKHATAKKHKPARDAAPVKATPIPKPVVVHAATTHIDVVPIAVRSAAGAAGLLLVAMIAVAWVRREEPA